MVNTHLYIFFAAIITCGFGGIEVHGVGIFRVSLKIHENEEVTLECMGKFDMAYCNHPFGKTISAPGASLALRHCIYKTKTTESPDKETSMSIEVQVTSRLAATQKTVSTAHGKEVTLSCTTVDRAPLKYCQFKPPAGEQFSVDSDVTAEKAILDRYYFPPNKSLDRGDCAVSIRKVRHEDMGRWTCGAGLGDGKEHLDTIVLQSKGVFIQKKESFIAFGTAGVVAFLGLLAFAMKKRCVRRVRDETVIPALPPNIRIPRIVIQSPTPSPSPSPSPV